MLPFHSRAAAGVSARRARPPAHPHPPRGPARPLCHVPPRPLARAPPLHLIHRTASRVFEYQCSGATIEPLGEPAGARGRLPLRAIPAAAAAHFLPKGFPLSVGADYLPYSLWCALAGVCGSAAGVLSTQSLLYAIGVGHSAALPLAASLNWVIKDGIGQLAAVASAAVISDRFDVDPKRWRAVAALSEAGARCLNASTPFAPWAFLPLASAANLGYSVACLAASATKADFHRSLTRQQNLGDLTAKAGSQAIVASLAGTAAALLLSSAAVATPADALVGTVALSAAQLLAIERALQHLALPTLTPPAGAALLRAHLDGAPMPSPSQFAATQRHVAAPRGLSAANPLPLRLGSPSLLELVPDPAALCAARSSCAGARHLLTISACGEVHGVMLDTASPQDVLLALLHAGLLHEDGVARVDTGRVRATLLDAQRQLPSFVAQMQQLGWDLSSASKLEAVSSRLTIIERLDEGRSRSPPVRLDEQE
ncbi:hypothetical protein AB1Y20_001111 [Prymnesium parvum]|uniref:Protein root UVB sensitive/RUS domain-containing protein n=1 Tax=Prymnesium parvum TaxID=97485 RepID=A0AB34K7T2_PRYPA